ncbi:hypothetical protein [uncultured Nocardioides sp.]|uniref:hypothetical protein n=1 Tax=uncultured Nocardioides sp. TaxID=198441 RepID=UPI00262B0800|nr:hypothetical protein [uncultured Nocardioides sp.]
MQTRLVGLTLAAVLPALVLAGCSGSEEPEAEASASPSVTESATEEPSATPSIDVPDGVELTTQGSALEVGDTATVAYEVDQSTVGVLAITVTDMRRTTFKQSFQGWKLGKQLKKANPYFVEATFKNKGETDLGGQRPPLYIVDGNDTLVESSTFVSDFDACPSKDFPKKFKPGKKVTRCLVYLAPDAGELVAVSFRPAQEFNPITWSGDVLKLGAKRKG